MDKKTKIVALLAKASAKGVTEAEAQSYMDMATKLMNKYQIEEAELRGIDPSAQASARIESKSYLISNKANRGKDRMTAVSMVVKAMGGRSVYRDSDMPTVPVRFTVLATVGMLEMLDLLIPALLEQVEYHANKASRARVKYLISEGVSKSKVYASSPKFRKSFVLGYGAGVREQIEAAQAAQEAAAGTLVLVGDRKRVEEEYASRYAHVKAARKSSAALDASGFYKGAAQGRKANLHTTAAL